MDVADGRERQVAECSDLHAKVEQKIEAHLPGRRIPCEQRQSRIAEEQRGARRTEAQHGGTVGLDIHELRAAWRHTERGAERPWRLPRERETKAANRID